MKLALFAALSAGLAASAPVEADDPVSTPTPTTLQPGAYWIRAVEAPNFHKYLQTKPANVPGTAILDSYTTAGQFNIEDGQLVNKVSNPPLYLWVEEPADKANPPRTLATFFNTTKNPFGTFAWQGDALTWSVPSIKRQNLAAWLVCEKQALFVNTGAYGYQTPSGCADQTIHYYNDKTANN
ncbi:bd6c0bca-53d7-4967-a6a4-9adccae7b7f8 [Thermothielavioides terrestris]|uniref:Bd6c0bca-53d7-4967-a6a4-9adccae7b7f8 n=1 Tax=Thermothielavioides terrestris TaxID=2587410 RepID=A0A3S4C8M2_9PEZI|nr:bd6c0bca-53d7-4967-a6a4-9adccae7b7f8 [Thermothielavioides terrestris]